MPRKALYGVLVLTLTLVPHVGCGNASTDRAGGPSETSYSTTSSAPSTTAARATSVASGVRRDAAPTVAATDLKSLVEGNSTFAFDSYRLLAEQEGNLFFSPYSISLALAMTYGGARGDTEQQMARALRFSLPQDRLHSVFNWLDQDLSARGTTTQPEGAVRLDLVHALWGQEGHNFLPTYLDLLAENYGAGLLTLDFAGSPELSRAAINGWIRGETEGRIEELIPAGLIGPQTRLVLTDVVYFSAAWQHPFSPDATRNGQFHRPDGVDVPVRLMKQTTSLNYAQGPDYQAVEVPYAGGELSMTILLPSEDRFSAFEEGLDAAVVSDAVGAFEPRDVVLTMPRFEGVSSLGLKSTLSELGMPDAFSGAADLSGIDGSRNLYIAEVVHQTFVSIDEAGTEAAAATGVVMPIIGIPESPVNVTLDRPFFFLIRDLKTETVLFVGRVVDPSSPLARSFPDVPADDPYYAAIEEMRDAGIVDGYDNGDFGLGDQVRRAQFAKMMCGALGLPVGEQDVCAFTDVELSGPGELYPDNYVAAVASKGITVGVSPGLFAPYRAVSRAQVLSMVVRAADLLAPGMQAGAVDPAPVHEAGVHTANVAVAAGWGLTEGLQGFGSKTWNPWAAATREEAAQILFNMRRLTG